MGEDALFAQRDGATANQLRLDFLLAVGEWAVAQNQLHSKRCQFILRDKPQFLLENDDDGSGRVHGVHGLSAFPSGRGGVRGIKKPARCGPDGQRQVCGWVRPVKGTVVLVVRGVSARRDLVVVAEALRPTQAGMLQGRTPGLCHQIFNEPAPCAGLGVRDGRRWFTRSPWRERAMGRGAGGSSGVSRCPGLDKIAGRSVARRASYR